MTVTLDPHLFTQIGLDSAGITMLGTVVHPFAEPGEYRCVVHEGEQVRAVFIVHADKGSPAAQVSVDLAALVPGARTPHPEDCACCGGRGGGEAPPPRFVVNPRGYVLFHVSRGAGGYYVHARRMDANQEDKGYDTRMLAEGDVFTAIVLRPGTYSLRNPVTGAQGEMVVRYPKRGERRYRPPAPVRVASGARSFEPARLEIDPGQGVIFEQKVAGRIVITLEKPDDGPHGGERPPRPGLVVTSSR